MHYLYNGPKSGPTIILAHGAGAAMDTEFMTYFAEFFACAGLRVVRFEFAYMAARRAGRGRRPPNRQPELLACWRQVLADHARAPLIIGGKSMGGRMASLIADEPISAVAPPPAGLLCLSYPFYAAGKPEKPRTAHLRELACPTLIVQGARDRMGDKPTVAGYDLAASIALHWAADGDHDLKPRKRSGYTVAENWRAAAQAAVDFAGRCFAGA